MMEKLTHNFFPFLSENEEPESTMGSDDNHTGTIEQGINTFN